jgi:phospholipase/lecithinase/hemolysin
MNEFSQYHNKLLVDELEKLRKLHPGVVIIYADYYGAAMKVFRSPEQFGEFKAFYSTMKSPRRIQEKYLLLANICLSQMTPQTGFFFLILFGKKVVIFIFEENEENKDFKHNGSQRKLFTLAE